MMDINVLMETRIFTWIIPSLPVFLARIHDATVGMIQIMFVARGNQFFTLLLGF